MSGPLKVLQLFKRGERPLISNYRPIFLLTGFSIIFKVLIFRRIKQHLVNHNIVVPERYSFGDSLWTDTATYKLLDTIFNTRNKKEYIAGTFCHLTKAFDCVNHKLLFSKLNFYGVRGVILERLKSYLSNRKQRVDLEFIKTRFYCSGWETVERGVCRALFWDSCCLIYTSMIFQK